MNQQQSMNRQQKRLLRKQGEIDAEGTPIVRRQPPPSVHRERTPASQFIREVFAELRKVAWPSRSETFRYSVVVFVTVIVLTVMIYGLDWVFVTFVLELFKSPPDPLSTL